MHCWSAGPSWTRNAFCFAELNKKARAIWPGLFTDGWSTGLQFTSRLLRALQAHGKNVARRTVEDVVGGRAEQQRQAMPAMAADNDQVAALCLGQLMDLLSWLAIGEMAVADPDFRVLQLQGFEFLFGLVELLLLQLGKVHRYIATKGHGHGFNDMHQGQFGAIADGEFASAADNRIALFSEVYSDQNVFVWHEEFLFRIAITVSMALFTLGWVHG